MGLLLLSRRRRGGIPRAGLLAEYRLDEGAGQFVLNRARGATPPVNLLAGIEDTESLTVASATLTRQYAADPDGGTEAWRFQTSTGGRVSQFVAHGAGAHTFSVYVRSNTGANQDFRLNVDSGITYQTYTATPTWQRVSLTQTLAAGAHENNITNTSPAGTRDLLFYGPQFEAGAAPTPYAPRGDLHLGLNGGADSNDPTWANGGLHFAGTTQQASATLGGVTTLSQGTFYALARWTDGAVTPDARTTTLLSDGTNATGLHGSTAAGGGAFPALWPCGRWGDQNYLVEARNVRLDLDGNWHVLAFASDGTTLRLWYDGWLLAERDRANTVALRRLCLGGRVTNGDTWPGDVAYALAYQVAHTDAQVKATTRALATSAAARGIAIPATPALVVAEGDSITADWETNGTGGYVWWAVNTMSPRPLVSTRAIPGSRTGPDYPGVTNTMVHRAASIDAQYDPARARNIMTVLSGTNDIHVDPDSAAQVWSELRDYCLARRAVGWKVGITTLLPDNFPGAMAKRNAVNALLYADHSFADILIDFAGDPTMGPDAAASDPSLYTDGTHPAGPANQTYLAPLWKAAVETLLA